MIIYRKAKEADAKEANRLLRRVTASAKYDNVLFPFPLVDEEKLNESISNGKCYLALVKKTPIALAIVEKDVSSYFYPKSHDGGKLMELIGKTEWKMNEDVIVLAFLSVDPLYRDKGIGSEMLSYIEREFPRFLFLSSLDVSNAKGVEYLRKNGYKRVDLENFEYSNTPQQLLFKRL